MGLKTLIAVALLLAAAGAAQAQTTLCGQKVDHAPITAGELAGAWEGEYSAMNSYQRTYHRCLGMLIWSPAADGSVTAQYIFGDTGKFPGQGSFAAKPSQGSWTGKLTGNVLTLGPLRNLKPSGSKRLEGNYVDRFGSGPAWFSRK